MEKNTLENHYEFLTATNEPGAEFFLVQDDGTFLINRSEAQLVSAVNGDQCTIYDVSNTQFLVDNNTCLVPVPDGYIMPESSTNDLYGNKDSMVQSESDAPVEDTDLQTTEITLSNEQYRLLEQNGWSLLEVGDKVLMLDSSGLQDITGNIDLIQQLKAEIQNNAPEVKVKSSRSILKNNLKASPALQDNEQRLESLHTNDDTIELVFENDSVAVEPMDVGCKEAVPAGQNDETPSSQFSQSQITATRQNVKKAQASVGAKTSPLTNPFRLRTEYCLTEIPDKVILGKTVNGKNLVARVTTVISSPQNKLDTNKLTGFVKKDIKSSVSTAKTKAKVESKLLSKQVAWRNASHLRNLPIGRGRSIEDDGGEKMFGQAIEGAVGGPLTAKQMAAAEIVVVQLMQMPALMPMIENTNLIITKVIKTAEPASCIESFVLTGRMSANSEHPQFVHMPSMIQDIREKQKQSKNPRRTAKTTSDTDDNCTLLHIHITETKYKDQEDAISITLNKRSLQPKNQPKAFDCNICAMTFKTADELTEHQESHDMDSEDILTIDTENVDGDIEDDRLLVMLHRK